MQYPQDGLTPGYEDHTSDCCDERCRYCIPGNGSSTGWCRAVSIPTAKASSRCSIPAPWGSKQWSPFTRRVRGTRDIERAACRRKACRSTTATGHAGGDTTLTWGGGNLRMGKKAGAAGASPPTAGLRLPARSMLARHARESAIQNAQGKSRLALQLYAANEKTGASVKP